MRLMTTAGLAAQSINTFLDDDGKRGLSYIIVTAPLFLQLPLIW